MAGSNDFYTGLYLRVDLTTGKITKEQLDPQMVRKYIGGNGIGTKIIYDEVPPSVGPFDPENRLVINTGPLNGTRLPGTGTYHITTKGPLTNKLCAAQSNGFFGARLRFAGYDGIIFQGASPEWVYLWINDGEAELRPADHLLGLDTWETQDRLQEELGGRQVGVACIGPAGENLVRYAAIYNDHGHLAATNGPGAVMGSKRLKAIAALGPTGVKVHDPERIESLRAPWLEYTDQTLLGYVKHVGTIGGFSGQTLIGVVPVKNYTTTLFPEHAQIDGSYIREHFDSRKRPCWACPWAHCHEIKITEGKHKGFVGEEPEYESQAAFSAMVGVTDAGEMLYLANMCDRLGFDAKELGFTLGMAMECYNEGLIGPEQTDGLDLKWGNAEAIDELIHNIAHRRGFGNVLAEGTKRASDLIGGDAPNRAVYMKDSISPHTHDDRGHWGLGLVQVFSDYGTGVGYPPDFYPNPDIGLAEAIKPQDPVALPKWMARAAGTGQFHDTLGQCFFLNANADLIADGVNAATGWDLTAQEALETGRRILNLQRAYSIRHGIEPEKWDSISPRYATEVPDGPLQGSSVGPHVPQMRRDYYRHLGWDEATSKPLPETLRRLGLEDVIADLWG